MTTVLPNERTDDDNKTNRSDATNSGTILGTPDCHRPLTYVSSCSKVEVDSDSLTTLPILQKRYCAGLIKGEDDDFFDIVWKSVSSSIP